MTEQTVTYEKENGATTNGQIVWVAEHRVNGWLVARGKFETSSEAWAWLYEM